MRARCPPPCRPILPSSLEIKVEDAKNIYHYDLEHHLNGFHRFQAVPFPGDIVLVISGSARLFTLESVVQIA